jgi:hypothetical protein
MNPEELEQLLIARLNALPTTENRLLYDLDYDERLVIETAKNLLVHNPFPLLPRLNAHRLTILAAFALAMADDEYAELDSFYNRLSDIFFANAPLDVHRQDEIRDFVEETCNQYGLRFLRNQNRLVRNTIWLHGGLPSRHWESFFKRVLMRVEESLENLDALLNLPTPRTIRRFFDLCGNSARTFLRDCIEMREALLQPDANTYSAEDFGVSQSFFDAFKQYLQNNKTQVHQPRSTLFFDERRLRVIELPQGNEIKPTQDWYAFRTNGKYLSRCRTELPKATIVFICKNEFRIKEKVPRPIETEHLFGNWNGYRCEWLNLENQHALTLTRGNDEFRIDVISTPSVSLIGKKLTLNNCAVLVQHQGSELEVFTTLPELAIENVSERYLERLRLYVNGEQRNIKLAQRTPLAQLNLPEGIHTLQLRGARGLDPIQFAYLPNLQLQLDKNKYRANESPTLLTNGEKPCLLPHNTPRATIKYKSYTLSIPVPLFGWQITGDEFTSEPISIAANKLPIRQGEKYLTVCFGNRHETCATLHLKRGDEILQRKTLSISDGYLKLDLTSYRDIANANHELNFIFTIGNDVIPVLRTFKEWEPNIEQRIDGRVVTLTIQDNAEGFRNRELIFWNLCRLWEKPIVVQLPDGANEITHTIEHEGEYGIQARIRASGWGRPRDLSPFDVPTSFNTQFQIGNTTFKDFLRQRKEELCRILLNNEAIPVRQHECIAILAYLLKKEERECVKRWIQLFLGLPEAIHNRFQSALYSETHAAVQAVQHMYEHILPKYGFPVDVVQLDTSFIRSTEAQGLDLQRDLRQAIAEYAPESEVVARKKIWTSWGLKIVPGRQWERRAFKICENCGRYESVRIIDDAQLNAWRHEPCRGCGSTDFKLNDKFIFPEFGFIAAQNAGNFTGRRPERTYASQVYFAGDGQPLQERNFQRNGITLHFQSASNAKLGVINRTRFRVCALCGYSTTANGNNNAHNNHLGRACNGQLSRVHLGHEFKTDVVKITLPPAYTFNQQDELLSILYALIEGLSNALNIARTDLDGCLYFSNRQPTLVIYDNVPGGAGHVRRITDEDGVIEEMLQEAYKLVKNCTCGGKQGDAACYACLQNYNNQFFHDQLKRKYAIQFLKQFCEQYQLTLI